MNRDVDSYISRSDKWPAEIAALRPILVGAGLVEEFKWRQPCYTYGGKNIVILQEMNDFLALMFFKGALLDDPAQVLEEQGPNTRSARRIRFTSVDDVARLAGTVTEYVKEAIRIEKEGRTVDAVSEFVPVAELQLCLDQDPEFSTAFGSLSPGRQREYNIYFSGAKKSETRSARINKYAEKILTGKGLRDR